MTAQAREASPEVVALWAQLDAVTNKLSSNRGTHDELLVERNRLFDALVAAGEKQAVIARRVGITRGGVNFALKSAGREGEG